MHSPANETTLARGAALGRFVVLGCVGKGAMGEVYAAYDPDLDRKIAIKLVRADRSGDAADDRARLMREAQATAKVSHPNVVVVYDAGTSGERVFIAMEFVEGHTLRYWLEQKPRSWPEILETFLAAGRGLAAAHERELVHRDFKPDNVMVGNNGQVRVMDFGLVRLAADPSPSPPTGASTMVRHLSLAAVVDVDSTAVVQPTPAQPTPAAEASPAATGLKLTQTGAMLGTPAYMSPEQFQGRAVDARSDQFSFCVALWEAIYGERPFAGRSLAELADNVVAGLVAPAPARSQIPAWLRNALARGLRPQPDERFESMTALLRELDRRPSAGRGGFANGAAAKLAGVWEVPDGDVAADPPHKLAIREAFLATGKAYAEVAFTSARAVLDRYARRWTDLYVDVCEATHVRGEQSAEVLDLRMECLQEGLEDLKALCRLFRAATAEVVENAVSAATALGTLERCENIDLLRAVVRPPDDPATRAVVNELRARIVDVRALLRVGRYKEALDAAQSLVQHARRVGYGPTLAEILFVHGVLECEMVRVEDGLVSMEEAVWTAELSRHDELAAEAATFMVALSGSFEGRAEVAEMWCRYTAMLLTRMGGHDQLWGWYYNNRGIVRQQQGRLREAIADAELAIEAKQRALGAEAGDVGNSLTNLADCLMRAGETARALEISERAVAILNAGFGPDHPKTAIGLTNHAEFLARVGRDADVPEFAQRAIAIFERETDPDGLSVTYPLLALGLSRLGTGRVGEAVALLERAVRIREARESHGARLGEVHFALGRALEASGGDRARAVSLVRQARPEYLKSPSTPLIEQDLERLDAWLAARGQNAEAADSTPAAPRLGP